MFCDFLVRLLQKLPERKIYDLYNIPKIHPFTPILAWFRSCVEWLAVAKSLGLRTEQRLHGLPPTRSESPCMEIIHLNQRTLATRWDVSEATLERWRSEGIGPIFLKLQGRVLYRLVDIENFESACLRTSTSQSAA